MRLLAYYIGHTFINTIRKLLKTWLAFFFIIIVFGGLVGFIAGNVASSLEKKAETVVEETVTEEVDDSSHEEVNTFLNGLFPKMELEKEQIIELAISGLFILMLFLSLINSKGIGEIFQPADVVMLFSAPLKPQTVMLFRLITTLGMQVVFSLIMLFQLPNLIVSAGMSVWSAFTLIIAWGLLALFTTLLQVLLYILSSKNEFMKKNLKLFIGAVFGLIAAVFIFEVLQNDRNILLVAVKMFTGEGTYWVPFWGWMRGFCMNAVAGNNPASFMYLAFNILGMAVLVAIIWNLKVDYYEDAVVATEKKAAAIESAKNNTRVRTKDRSDRIKRDGFDKGNGASVFYYKTLYNRRRMGVIGGITKTMLLYFAIAAFIVVLGEIKEFKFTFLAVSAAMTFIAFYRTLGNPLREDITKEFFTMIPAPARAKLFYSLLGGLANTFMDMVVPFAAAAIWLKISPIEAVLWLLFILSIDLYGTLVGTFIYLSVAMSLPDTVQKMVQIMFIYFGIMPAIAFVIVGIVLDMILIFLPIGIVFNLIMSGIFFLVVPKLMENGR